MYSSGISMFTMLMWLTTTGVSQDWYYFLKNFVLQTPGALRHGTPQVPTLSDEIF